jgi:pimeloyl-ACP methyl ester carboxylesterase
MPSATVNGISIAYEERGDGPPLLAIMGLGGQLTDWPEGLVDLLAARFRVVLFDNRDIGLSGGTTGPVPSPWATLVATVFGRWRWARPTSGYRLADMANDGVALLDHLGIDSAHVLGVSMGGMIGQRMAIDHAARVASLTSIMSSTGDPRVGRPSASTMLELARLRPSPEDTPIDELVAKAIELYRLLAGPGADLEAYRGQIRRSIERSYRPAGTARQLAAIQASPDRTRELAQVRAPTVVVHGLVDPLVRYDGGVATATAIAGSRLVLFPDMGHDLPRSRWVELVEIVAANADRGTDRATADSGPI